MTDIEKIFDAFRNCITKPKCRNCPWEQCEDLDYSSQKVEIPTGLALDVLNLLKTQTPVKVNKNIASPFCGRMIYHSQCPQCRKTINSEDNPKFCGRCGQAVKWNDDVSM